MTGEESHTLVRDLEARAEALRGAIASAEARRDAFEARLASSPPGKALYVLAVAAILVVGLGLGVGVRGAVAQIRRALPASPCNVLPMSVDTTITLERTACYGTCPAYVVTLWANGRVDYDGKAYVQRRGTGTVQIDEAEVRRVFELIAGSCFFDMRDEYVYPVSDNPSAIVTVSRHGAAKRVRHYPAGTPGSDDPSCAPAALTTIEQHIDAVAGSDAWFGHSDNP